MTNFFGNKRLIAILIGLIVLIAVMGATLKERPVPTWPERFAKDSVSFVQGILYKPTVMVSGFFDNIKHIYNIYEENKALKSQLDQHAQLQVEADDLRRENERLRSMLGIKDTKLKGYEKYAADVIARSPDRWNNMLTISKGKNDGIEPDMAVISAQGALIGRIQSVSAFSSQVELLMDIEQGNHISAAIQGNQAIYGVIESYDLEKHELIMRKIPKTKDLKITPGQYVTTSGMGGVMPPGLVIGRVSSVGDGDYGLTQTARITPLANFYQIEQVFVAKRDFVVDPAPVQQQKQNAKKGGK
ncbi:MULTISPECIES: rod shape-determining protein MreC [Aneurinibacillus]|uniref:Cell shape-determining protein MreC n=1 Tax=Aneurinibacillus danicus TaxID=267746 RepID=A0A511V525_9BACL|nr:MULTISPECIES: rod shape-determining protein MreC [Aneurinibacillus]GEN33038.1 cell shape-determining protein MreC [Aneurinibacillus danicus]